MTAAAPWPQVDDPVVLLAFAGWNDAGDAATDALEHLAVLSSAVDALEIDMGDYLDYQQIRPHILTADDGTRRIEWPSARVRLGFLAGRPLLLVDADEPNLRWRQFADEMCADIAALRPAAVVFLGALLADVPHTRATPVHGSSTDPAVAARCGFEESTYEGPTGIVGVLSVACAGTGLPVTSLWAAVPHYITQSPSPKAVVALLNGLEDVLGVSLNLGDYLEQARAWQRRCDELAADDEDLAEYISALEEQHDDASAPDATGDAIAREFERYLRRRGNQT